MSVRLRTISIFYVISGALGLIYEVAFSKYLGYAFGATAYASGAVLVAFMGGLALGAFVAGRLQHKVARPLLVYGLAETVIGVFCFVAPWIFGWVTAKYVHFASNSAEGSLATLTAARALFAVLVVLVPAAGMGTTLPLLARFVEEEDPANGSRRLAALYGFNTAGGAAGSLVSSYFVLPALGLSLSMRSSAVVSFAIGLVAITMGIAGGAKKAASPPKESAAPAADGSVKAAYEWKPSADESRTFQTALLLAAMSGILVFGCEVVFTHLLALVIGTSVYAFGLMLAIFLVCLSLGTPLSMRLERRYKDGALPISLAATGLALALSLLIWDRLPALFIALGPYVRSWPARETVRGMAAFFALFFPATLMGTTFPLVLRRVRRSRVGADVGMITAANTVGSIVGSLLFGFVVLPLVGSQRSVLAIAVSYAVASILVSRTRPARAAKVSPGRMLGWGVAALLVAFLVPKWDLPRLTSGANVYFDEGMAPAGKIEKLHEDIHGGVTTIVLDHEGHHTMLTNGKFQGNDSEEVRDNRGFAYLPAMYTPNRGNALVIGLGTGTTTGAVAAFGFKSIDVAELSPAITDYARTTFKGVNRDVLNDPRVHLLFEDGRNVLLLGTNKYDLITIEVTSIWFAGAANLYNREFYNLANARLTDTGVLQQWLQLHHTNRRTVATILATMRDAFPHMALFVTGHQGHMVASRSPLMVSREALETMGEIKEVAQVLGDERLVDYAKGIVLDETGIDRFLADTADELGLTKKSFISTDDNLLLEYETPRGNVPSADDIPVTVAYLSTYRQHDILLSHLSLR